VAFRVYFSLVENFRDMYSKNAPWRCDKCHKAPDVLLRVEVDYDTLILCKNCLNKAKKKITDKEKDRKKN
jgi:glutaredoxin